MYDKNNSMRRGSKEGVPKTAKSPASVDFRDFRSTSTHLAILTPIYLPFRDLYTVYA